MEKVRRGETTTNKYFTLSDPHHGISRHIF
jgi:hypothetical protein